MSEKGALKREEVTEGWKKEILLVLITKYY
jgi:hypothetical protein